MHFHIDGADLRYDLTGEGTPLLFLHAFPLGLTMWDGQAAALTDAARVLRFDARGFGGSSSAGAALTMERIADDAAALLDHLGIERAIVAGCSMGGYACLAMARLHPSRVRALILQDTRAGADSPEARHSRVALADRVRKEGSKVAADAFLPKLLGATTQHGRPELVEQVRSMILGAAPDSIADALLGLGARADSTPMLATLLVPTLVVCGEEDVLTPPSESEAMVAAIPGARLALIPRAGHLANLENPADYNRAVGEFVRRVGEE